MILRDVYPLDQTRKMIREEREKKGWSQDVLARRCGYSSRTTVCRIESGESTISLEVLMAIARALNVPPWYLLGYDPSTGELRTTREVRVLSASANMEECSGVVMVDAQFQSVNFGFFAKHDDVDGFFPGDFVLLDTERVKCEPNEVYTVATPEGLRLMRCVGAHSELMLVRKGDVWISESDVRRSLSYRVIGCVVGMIRGLSEDACLLSKKE